MSDQLNIEIKELEQGIKEGKEGLMNLFCKVVTDAYKENYNEFKVMYDSAIKNVNPIPEGTEESVKEDWKDAGIDKFTEFFREWYNWNPDVETGLEYIQKFSWIYYENIYGLEFVMRGFGRDVTRYFVEINGIKMDSAQSLPLVKQWEDELGDQMEEYIIPEGGYKSFNQFFSRELKKARPISSPEDDSVLVSPADAVVNMIDDNLDIDRGLQVKTQKLSVNQLLNQSSYADKFDGGTALSCILMPDVYHRFHSPIKGTVVEAYEDVAGIYFGIKDFPELLNGGNVGYGYDYSIFEHFRRGYLIIKTEDYGYVAMIPVGLNTISSVIFKEKFKKVEGESIEIEKGEEVGYFQYGGSLNILLFEKGVFPSVRIPQGQVLGQLCKKEDKKRKFTF